MIIKLLKNAVHTSINTISKKVTQFMVKPKKPAFPLADRLLADALRLGQLPSPTEQEKERASFVVERLSAMKLNYIVDDRGNILSFLHSSDETDISREPLLLFTRLVSERWNPLESLGKLELTHAQGAGLADAMGPAALLSIAEGYAEGRLALERELCLFFSTLHSDDPVETAFQTVIDQFRCRPCAAFGVRGFMLGLLTSHTLGSCRIEVIFTKDDKVKKEKHKIDDNAVVSALLDLTWQFQKTAESCGSNLNFYFRHIEARGAFDTTPSEGVLELELESANGDLLQMAMEKIKHVAESSVYTGVKNTLRVIACTPPGDPALNEEYAKIILETMKELKISATEEAKPDPASFLSDYGIPALSVGITSGRAGLTRDTVEIASVERGRQLLEQLVMKAGQVKNQENSNG